MPRQGSTRFALSLALVGCRRALLQGVYAGPAGLTTVIVVSGGLPLVGFVHADRVNVDGLVC